jgi:hypothetical protein
MAKIHNKEKQVICGVHWLYLGHYIRIGGKAWAQTQETMLEKQLKQDIKRLITHKWMWFKLKGI